MLISNVRSTVRIRGAGMAARWTTDVGAAERLDRLAEVGQVRPEERRLRDARRDDIDVDDGVTVLDEVVHHGAARLAAAAGHHDPGHRHPSGQCLWLGKPVDRIGRVLEPGLDDRQRRTPILEPRPEHPAAFGGQRDPPRSPGGPPRTGRTRPPTRRPRAPRASRARSGSVRRPCRPAPRRSRPRAGRSARRDGRRRASPPRVRVPASIDTSSASAAMSSPAARRRIASWAVMPHRGSRTCRTRRASRRR